MTWSCLYTDVQNMSNRDIASAIYIVCVAISDTHTQRSFTFSMIPKSAPRIDVGVRTRSRSKKSAAGVFGNVLTVSGPRVDSFPGARRALMRRVGGMFCVVAD